MKRIIRNVVITVLSFTSAAVASTTIEPADGSLLLTLFLGLCGMILVFQLIPALLLFLGMTKGLLSCFRKEKVQPGPEGSL